MQLIKCLDKKTPKKQMTCVCKSTQKRALKCQSRLAATELYCKYRMPYNKSSTKYEDRLIESAQCLEQYRVSCEDIPTKLFDSKYNEKAFISTSFSYWLPAREIMSVSSEEIKLQI